MVIWKSRLVVTLAAAEVNAESANAVDEKVAAEMIRAALTSDDNLLSFMA
jgi:hypothetical protein